MTKASWLKYPNPHINVIHYDTLSQSVDPKTGILHVTKLVCKRGILPKWGSWVSSLYHSNSHLTSFLQIMKNNPMAYVLEDIYIDPKTRTYQKKTVNLTHRKALLVNVTQKIVPLDSSNG